MCFVQSFLSFIDFMLYKLTKKETYTRFYIFHWLIFFLFSTCFLYIKKFYLIETFYVGKIKTFPHREGLLLALYLAVEANGIIGCTLYHFILGPSRLMTCPLCHFSRHGNKSLWFYHFSEHPRVLIYLDSLSPHPFARRQEVNLKHQPRCT